MKWVTVFNKHISFTSPVNSAERESSERGIKTEREGRRHFSGLLNYPVATWRWRSKDFEKWNVRGKGKHKEIRRRKSY